MAKASKKLDRLFYDSLKDIFFAEKRLLAALSRMARAANSNELRAAFEKHVRETEQQVKRLEKVFQLIEAKAQGKNCPAILGIIDEGQEVRKEYNNSSALDAGLVAAAQSVEQRTRFLATAHAQLDGSLING